MICFQSSPNHAFHACSWKHFSWCLLMLLVKGSPFQILPINQGFYGFLTAPTSWHICAYVIIPVHMFACLSLYLSLSFSVSYCLAVKYGGNRWQSLHLSRHEGRTRHDDWTWWLQAMGVELVLTLWLCVAMSARCGRCTSNAWSAWS